MAKHTSLNFCVKTDCYATSKKPLLVRDTDSETLSSCAQINADCLQAQFVSNRPSVTGCLALRHFVVELTATSSRDELLPSQSVSAPLINKTKFVLFLNYQDKRLHQISIISKTL